MPSSELRYVDPGVAPAYVPLSQTVIDPLAACDRVWPPLACEATTAAARAATRTAICTRFFTWFLLLYERCMDWRRCFGPARLARWNGRQGAVDCLHGAGDVRGVVGAEEDD